MNCQTGVFPLYRRMLYIVQAHADLKYLTRSSWQAADTLFMIDVRSSEKTLICSFLILFIFQYLTSDLCSLGFSMCNLNRTAHWSDTYHSLGYERVYLPLCKVADTPFHIQGDEYTLITWYHIIQRGSTDVCGLTYFLGFLPGAVMFLAYPAIIKITNYQY